MRVLDLFCGIGGLSYGFTQMGFKVTGIDNDKQACMTYELNKIGKTIIKNLLIEEIGDVGEFDLIIGGPPCEPWSMLNKVKRRWKHPAYLCLAAFYDIIEQNRPLMFIMENVPPVANEPLLLGYLELLSRKKYLISPRFLKYSDYGAAIARRRLFIIGVLKNQNITPEQIFDNIPRQPAKTLRDIIYDLREKKPDPTIEHIWPERKLTQKEIKKILNKQYAYRILQWDKPAPSFGNILKSHLLHPDSVLNGKYRLISVREALRIMGFPDDFSFPPNISFSKKYKMIANTVSPTFSLSLAKTIKNILT